MIVYIIMQTKKLRKRSRRRNQKGGELNLPLNRFYPQNNYIVDPQRMGMVGGRKNHSRKYLRRALKMKGALEMKGGSWGFFGNFGTVSGANSNVSSITGVSNGSANVGQRFLV
jgi:hypothetical protein